MTFDDQLRRAFDTLSDRLRDEIHRQVQAVMDELAASAHAERTAAIEAAVSSAQTEREAAVEAAAASARSDRDIAVEAALAVARTEREPAVDAAITSARSERDAAVEAALISARSERDAAIEAALESARAEREAAIETAVASAHGEREAAVEAAVASVRSEHDAAVEAAVAAAVATAQSERDAAVDAALASARTERDRAVEAALGAAAHLPHLAIDEPVVIRTDALVPVAAGVRAMAQATTLTGVLQALMGAAGASGAIANIWLVRGQRLEPWRQDTAGAPVSVDVDADNPIAEVVRSKASAARGELSASPLMLAGDVVAVLVTASHQPPAPSPDALDVLALYGSRALESITAFRTAQALARRPDDAGGAEPRRPAAATDVAKDEEHASAQRYARLLVSEIKLYHEAEVLAGRRDRDLATRLGGEIAHARVMYEQRVPAQVRQQADYFHDELLRTLANGDPTLLDLRTQPQS